MLPFLAQKKAANIIISKRGEHETEVAPEVGGEEIPAELRMAAEEVLRAIEKKSVTDLAHALHAAFIICEAYPHEEGEHMDEEEME